MDARGWLGLALLAALAAPARGADGDGFETLANGLRLAARPVKGARDAAVVLVFEVGEAHDPAGRSGLGHLLEHLFVTAPARGAARRTLEEVDARYPRGFHAHTGEGETVVAVVVPPEQLAAELAEAAARMGALAPEEEDLDRERAQILDELGAMYDRAPPLAAANRARERVFPPPPGARRGGTRAGLAAVSLALVRDRAARLYKPANAILVVAGAIDPAAALAAARAAFAPLAPGERAPLAARAAPLTTALPPIDLSLEGSVPERPLTAAALAAPPPGDRDYAAFLLLAARIAVRGPQGGVQVHFAPLEDGRVITLATERGPAAIAGFLANAPGEAARLAPSEGEAEIAGSLVLGNPAAMSEYEAGYRAAMMRRLGIDGAALRAAVARVGPADLDRAARTWLAPARAGLATVRHAPAAGAR